MRIGLTSIFVDDQDQAEQFYTEVLGFQVKTSAPYSDTERWLSVVAPEEPDGVELVLHLADEREASALLERLPWTFSPRCHTAGGGVRPECAVCQTERRRTAPSALPGDRRARIRGVGAVPARPDRDG